MSAAISVPADDADLVRAAATDPALFAAIYRRFVDDLYRYLLARCGNENDAEDLVAETFVAAMRGAHAYRGTGAVKAWLVGIARRKAADAQRARSAQVPLEAAATVADPESTADAAMRRVELSRVVAAISRLAPDRAEAVRLRFFAGLDFDEIARLMNRSDDAVRMLVHRGLRDLRERLEERA